MDGYVKIGFGPTGTEEDPSKIPSKLMEKIDLAREMCEDFAGIMSKAGFFVFMQVVAAQECPDGLAVFFNKIVRPDQAAVLLDKISNGSGAIRKRFGVQDGNERKPS